MAFQFDSGTRNSWATTLGTNMSGGTLKFWSGTEPANCAASDPGSGLLCTITLPSPCLSASGGSTTLVGTWQNNASTSGTATFFRCYSSGGTCITQGNVTSDLVLNNVNLTAGQPVTVTAYSLIMPGS